ncbi:MAG: hypothetical protein Q9162_006023 [Coniocarpon cinnabarinum]
MDHLPTVRDPTSRLPRVPYFEEEEFAFSGSFCDFDSRVVVPPSRDRSRAYSSFVQNWLFFGLLQAYFAEWSLPVSQKDFLEEVDGETFVTTRLLQDYLVAAVIYEHNRHQSLMRDKRPTNQVAAYGNEELQKAHLRIANSHSLLRRHRDVLRDEIKLTAVEPSIWDSILILGATLARAHHVIFRPVQTETQQEFQFVNYDGFRLQSVLDFRLSDQWCPHERKNVSHLISGRLPEVAFFSQLDRGHAEVSHADCTERECIAYQVTDKTAYRTRHVHDDCDCEMIGFREGDVPVEYGNDYDAEPLSTLQPFDADREELDMKTSETDSLEQHISDPASIESTRARPSRLERFKSQTLQLRPVQTVERRVSGMRTEWAKRVPAVTFVDGQTKTVIVPFMKAKTSGMLSLPASGWNLVAISHVWGDGLGNPSANKLPVCQLNRLQSMANGLYSKSHHPVPFWIDTLMIPVFSKSSNAEQVERQNDAKDLALRNMEYIYKGASKVLVLDRSLLSISTKDMPVEEIGAQLMASTWSRRLWTFQEGCDKDRTLFQFQDRTISWPGLHDEVQSRYKLSSWKSRSQLPKKHPVKKAQKVKWFVSEHGSRGDKKQITSPIVEALAHVDKRLYKVLNQVWHAIFAFLEEMTVDWSGDLKGERLARCMRGMYYRNCSRSTDEPLVLASLLSWRAGAAADVKKQSSTKEDRYKTLFQMLQYVPRDILFVDQVRYEEDGCRWMPTSLLGINSAYGKPIERTEHVPSAYTLNNLFRVRKASVMCDRHDEGIATALDGLRILPRPTRLTLPFVFAHRDHTWEVRVYLPGTNNTVTQTDEADWVILPESSFASQPSSCKAVLLRVKKWHPHRQGAWTRFEALATLRRVPEDDAKTLSLSHMEVHGHTNMKGSDLLRPKQLSKGLYDKWIVG